jgi:nephrocystin-3
VELVDVDLRWGITEEQAQRGEVLPICLAEIDRSRPYFMGFIGDRYGWVPEHHQYDLSLVVERPWLDEHRGGKSVTELEMLHGVLNNPEMAGRAFFYFRNSEYSQSKGGPYLSEGPDYSIKLEALKDRIRTSGFPVVENYSDPEALAERVKADLWRVIDEAYPMEDVPDPLTLERRKHEAYGGSRLGLYLGGKQYFQALDAAMIAESFKPVLITGASGGGKSALIANWSRAYSESHPDTLEIVHYLGSGADAADPVKLVTRLLQEISRITGDELKLESDPQKILDALPEWLARASSYAEREGRQWLILLDGLDKLSSLRDLRWWPGFLPPRVKLVVSCLDGEVQDEARKRMGWAEIKVLPLSSSEGVEILQEYLRQFNKTLPPLECALIAAHPLSTSPLFVRILAEEMRVFGQHELLHQKLESYLSATTIDGLFAKVLERIEGDNKAEDVRSSLSSIWASRAGLSQDELLSITALVPATWAPIRNALNEAILESSGRVQFAHDYIRKAVEERYLSSHELERQAHLRIAEWFVTQEVTPRVAEELPWQWVKTEEFEKLESFLLNLSNLSVMGEASLPWTEIHQYWDCCGGEEEATKYLPVLQGLLAVESSQQELDGCKVLLELASKSRWLFTSVKIDRLYLEIVLKKYGKDHPETLIATASLGSHLGRIWAEDAHDEAEILLQFVYDTRKAILGSENLETLDAENDLGVFLSGTRFRRLQTLEESKGYLEEAVLLRTKLIGQNHYDTLISQNNLAILYWRMARPDEAVELLKSVVGKMELTLGRCHPETLVTTNNLAAMLRDHGDVVDAESLLVSTIKNMDTIFGSNHRDTLNCIQDLGILLRKKGDEEGANKLNAEIWKRRGLGSFPS